jgi:hypothetical protein
MIIVSRCVWISGYNAFTGISLIKKMMCMTDLSCDKYP